MFISERRGVYTHTLSQRFVSVLAGDKMKIKCFICLRFKSVLGRYRKVWIWSCLLCFFTFYNMQTTKFLDDKEHLNFSEHELGPFVSSSDHKKCQKFRFFLHLKTTVLWLSCRLAWKTGEQSENVPFRLKNSNVFPWHCCLTNRWRCRWWW